MFENKTKTEIYQFLLTADLNQLSESMLLKYSAAPVAQQLNISRNLASQYLNELFYDGFLIKIGMRPTCFLPKKELEKHCQIGLQESYASLELLMEEVRRHPKEDSIFQELIGYNGSLSYEVEQCKAAVNYPGNGLPILLYGQTGTGKSCLAERLYQYCLEKKLIKNGKMVTVNCAEYASNAELFLTNLFGYRKGSYTGADKDASGLLKEADGGMLFFDEIHSLTPECQEKLFLFMDQGIYHMVGDNHTWYKSNIRFVFATTENPEKSLLKTLLRRIPIVVKLPALSQRPTHEKKQLISLILKKESEKLNRPIQISSIAYQQLLDYEFKGNLGELKNSLQISVASAYLKGGQNQECVNLHLNDLPALIVKNRSDRVYVMDESQRMLTLDNLELKRGTDSQYLQLFKSILKYLEQYRDSMMDQETFFNCIDLKLEQFVNFLFYEGDQAISPQNEIVGSILMNINRVFFKKFNVKELSNNELHILTRYFVFLTANDGISDQDLKKQEEPLGYLEDLIQELYPRDLETAKEFIKTMENNLNQKYGRFEVLLIFFFLRYFHREMEDCRIPVIILAHGYNIASGIAELANQLLHCHIFTAIDMPIESHFDLMTTKLKEYIEKLHGNNEVIVMVDMGSLEEFHNYIENFVDLDVGIINNVTTKLALDIGSMIINDYPMTKILEEAKQRSEPNYVIIRRRNRRKAIFTVCASGYGIACKFATLLENSFPRKLDLDVLPVSYQDLDFKGRTGLLDKYDVLMMVGTLESKNTDIPFHSIEDIINQRDAYELLEALSPLMSEEELKIFNQNIVKNFSLENLMDYLTILNPEKIIGYVEKIVQEIQNQLHEEFSNSVLIGLYLHISCMIERLILNKQLSYDQDTREFEATHQHFIDLIRSIFRPVLELYNVVLPIEEIEYIHDYVFHEESVEEKLESVEKKEKEFNRLMEEVGFDE